MNSQTIAILLAFAAYLIMMIAVGVIYMKKNSSTEDFFLGGRGLGGWTAALSAQASDMSGWLLMGLPGAVYAYGTGQAWIAIGLFLGTVFNWVCISGRLRKYTIRANNSLTLPEFFKNRFHDESKILLGLSTVIIVIFFQVYTASAFAAGGKLFHSVFHIDYTLALTIGVIVILSYTFMGGFMAVCTTDFIQGTLMLIGLICVPLLGYGILQGADTAVSLEGTKEFFNLFYNNGEKISAIEILSQLAWGLGYCGMPHILVRFMAIRDEKELKKSRVIAIVWVILSLGMACIIGLVGRELLGTKLLDQGTQENVFIEMILYVFVKHYKLAFIGGIFLCGILAAIMSTADSQLLVTASGISEDIYSGICGKKADDKTIMRISRFSVIAVAIIGYIIAFDPNSSVMGLVSNAWAGLGSAFGPIVLLSLFWKRTSFEGAVAGILSGGLTVIIWDYIPLAGGKTLGAATGIYSLLIGFGISLICIVIVSLLSKEPSKEILQEFEDVRS